MNTQTTPKDFFLQLGATAVLYTAAVALINLAFSAIDYAFPDQLAGYFSVSSVAWPISMLLVLIPVLYLLEWLVRRDAVKVPEKRGIWISRWRTYLTLFLSGATIVGDLIALVNTYLNGEITDRFVYKISVVFVVTGVIFAYYILDRAADRAKARTAQVSLAVLGIVLVLASIVGGFLIVGSPGKQRALRFDSQRVSDLTNIQWRVVSYWQSNGKLPADLSVLNDSISGFMVPSDPETHAAYEYVSTTTLKFELCAAFALQSLDTSGRGVSGQGGGGVIYPTTNVSSSPYYPGSGNDSWAHPSGRFCFDRTIDPKQYPIYDKSVPIPAAKPVGV